MVWLPAFRQQRFPSGRFIGQQSAAATGSIWTPESVSTAQHGFWGESNSMVAAAGVLTSWDDKFSNGLGNFTPVNGPLYNTTDAAFVDGISFSLLEVSSQYLQGPGLAADYVGWQNDAAFTCGISFVLNDYVDNTQMLLSNGNTVTTQIQSFLRIRGGARGVYYAAYDGTPLIQDITEPILVSGSVNNVVIEKLNRASGSFDYNIWVNRFNVASGEITGSWPSGNPGSPLRLGCRGGALSEFFKGRISNFIWFKDTKGAELANYLESIT